MRVWAGAIALGLVMGLPIGGAVWAIEPRVIDGELTTDDRKLDNGKYLDVYQFQGQAGERVAIELESDAFDAVLGVVHNRALLVGDNNSGGLTDALIVVELPETGAYQVLVNTVKVGATGKYRLSWRAATLGDQQRLEAFQLNRQALQLSARSQLRESMTLLQRANQLYGAAGDRIGESTTLNNIGEIYRSWGQYPQALESYQQSLAIGRDLGDRTVEGTVLSNLGLVYYSQGNYAQALDYYQQALAIRREVSDRVGEGVTLNSMGLAHSSRGNYPQALEYYQQSLAIRRETGDRRGEGTTLNNIGLIHHSQGQYSQALEYYQQSLGIRRETGDRLGEGTTLNNIGAIYKSRGQYPQALEHYQQALAILQAVGDRTTAGTTLNNMGEIYRGQGNLPQALAYYQQSLTIRREVGDQAGEGVTLNNIGTVYQQQGQYPQALDYFQQALAILRAVGGRAGEGATLNNIGSIYKNQGQYPQALDYYQQALALRRDVGDRSGEGGSLSHIGGIYHLQGNYAEALDYYQQALAIRREVGDRPEEGVTLSNIGIIYGSQGQYAQALAHYQQSLAIRREVGDRHGEGVTLNNIGLVHHRQGQPPQALDYFQQALAIVRDVGDRAAEGSTLNNIGSVYQSQGQFAVALEHFQKSLAISRDVGNRAGEGINLDNIGLVHYSQGQYPQALDYFQQALVIRREVGDRANEGSNLSNIGAVYERQGQYSQALDFYQKALAITREVGNRAGESTTLSNIGVFHYRQGQYAQALAPFRQSIATSEAIEQDLSANDQDRIAFFETRAATYTLLNATLIHQNQTAAALELADRSRARSLVQFLTPSSGDQSGQGINQGITINQIKRLARDKNATLITYAIVNADLYIWVVSPTGELNFVKSNPESAGLTISTASSGIRSAATLGPLNDQLFNRAQYRIDLQALRGEGTGPLWAGSPQHLEQGYNLLIKPIEAYLPKPAGSRLIIVPHRELGTVPFAALFKEGEGFLIDRYTITVTPSLQTLNTLQQKKNTAIGSPLVVGNPSPMVNQLSQLPGTEIEATAIAQKLNTPPILGNQATEAAINAKLSTANILHFATHGVIPKNDRDLNSWLALADISSKSGEDNKLTISEIFNSNLNAQLAVLSACNTNSGEISGEGVVGLARAFLKAGVPTVVASSWKVPDRETQILMEEFYDQLLAGKTYAEALRAAQLKVRSQSPNPFAWAAFTVIGEGDRALIQN